MSRAPGASARGASGPSAPESRETSAFRHRGRHWLSLLTVAATLFLIFAGGLVTSHGAGLSVPDWPLSYGMLMPPMVGNVFYEHGHRMAATAVGFLTLVLAVWTARVESRAGVRKLAWLALAAVIAQGVLGGLTVLYLLPTPISVTHACLAQTFFCLVIALAYSLSAEWREAEPAEDRFGLRIAAVSATAAVYLQLVLGAVMRHIGAGLAIPDFPLALGHVLPPFDNAGIAVHFAHRLGALLALIAVARLVLVARRTGDRRFSRPASFALFLTCLQIGLGAAAVLTGKAITPTTLHVANGAAVLGTCWWLTLRAYRSLRSAAARAVVPHMREQAATS